MIKDAPLSIAFAVALLTAIGWVVIYQIYDKVIDLQDKAITSLEVIPEQNNKDNRIIPKDDSKNSILSNTLHPTSTPESLSYLPAINLARLINDNTIIAPAIRQASGSLYRNSDNITPAIRLGDWFSDRETRGVMSFNLKKIPSGVEIVSAKLYFNVDPIGDLNATYFHTIVIEAINIGDRLNRKDFNKEGIIEKGGIRFSYRDIKKPPFDVTKEIKKYFEDGRDIATFRLRFTEGTDLNSEDDRLAVSYECCMTMLLIKFKPDN